MDSHPRRRKTLWLLLGLPVALLLVVFVLASFGGGGHPPLGPVLLYWATWPTLAGYLSRTLLGSDFPSMLLLWLGFLEYVLVGAGLASLISGASRTISSGGRVAIAALVIYAAAQGAAHLLLNVYSVNMRLMASTNPGVSMAAVDRIRDSGDAAAVPALQQKLIDDFQRDGNLDAGLLDALTVLGGARGWQDLLESGRFGVTGPSVRAWRFIVAKVREMTNPMYSEAHGGIPRRGFSDEDIARFFDALAQKLAERLQAAPDRDASLALMDVMKERPQHCQKYAELVPPDLRAAPLAPCR